MNYMTKIYADLVQKGAIKIESIKKEEDRKAVEALLKERQEETK